MNLDQTFAVLFWLVRKTINNLGQAPIYTRITIDGARTEITTSRTIDQTFGILKKSESPVHTRMLLESSMSLESLSKTTAQTFTIKTSRVNRSEGDIAAAG